MESSSSILGGTGMVTRVSGADMDIARGMIAGDKDCCCTGDGLVEGGMYVGMVCSGLACIFGSE